MPAKRRQDKAGVDAYLYHRFAQDRPEEEAAEDGLESFGSPNGRSLPRRGPPRTGEPMRGGETPSAQTTPTLPVLIRLRNPDRLPEIDGVEVHSRMGSILTAHVTEAGLEALRAWPNALSIEASRGGGGEDVTQSIPFVGASAVHTPPLDERGADSMFGLIDTGLDVLHQAFQNPPENGGQPTTRVVALWDQTDLTGPTPKVLRPDLYTQNHGTLHLAETINQWIRDDQVPRDSLRDPGAHGTHVASIAAGSAIPGRFLGGVAPESVIAVVIPRMSTGDEDPMSLGYSNSHVDALDFLRRTANGEGLPIVVNVSLGMNAGAHDGTSLLEAAFDAFSGGGRDPGYVIVKSAGNERGHSGHAEVRVFEGGITSIEWDSGTRFRSEDYVECWFESSDRLEFTAIDPAGNTVGPASDASLGVKGTIGGNAVGMTLTRFHHDNGDSRLVLTIRSDTLPIQDGRWRLEIRGHVVNSEGIVNAWVERDRSRSVRFVTGNVNEMTLSIPGTALTVLTVGACESGDPLRLSSRSSWGPTRDGRTKPDIVAPGVAIEAASAGGQQHDELIRKTGTSMAAPHVSGGLALLLSHRERLGHGQLNVAQIRAGLSQVAANYTGRWHEGFGYGRLNVHALLEQFST